MGDAKVPGVPHDGLGVIKDFEVLAMVVEALYICLGPVTQATYSSEASLKPKLRLRLMTTGPSFTSRPVSSQPSLHPPSSAREASALHGNFPPNNRQPSGESRSWQRAPFASPSAIRTGMPGHRPWQRRISLANGRPQGCNAGR